MPKEETRRWERYNANPTRERVGDCVVRAIAVLTGKNWDTVYIDLCVQGLLMGDMPTANHVWGSYLRAQGYKRAMLGDDCTVQQFADENRSGKYILAMPAHVVTVVEGKYIDTWDCGDEVPVYFWRKEDDGRSKRKRPRSAAQMPRRDGLTKQKKPAGNSGRLFCFPRDQSPVMHTVQARAKKFFKNFSKRH